ncbi:MAG: acetyltransferase, partial [Sphingobacteriia bacterium 35-40-5]
MDLFEQMLAGGLIPNDHPQLNLLWEAVAETIQRSALLNSSTSVAETRNRISEIIGKEIDQSTTIFVPFHTNF